MSKNTDVIINRSSKPIKTLAETLGQRAIIIPARFANERDPETDKSCVFIGANGVRSFIPVEEPVVLTSIQFAVLKDCGIICHETLERSGLEFDPVHL